MIDIQISFRLYLAVALYSSPYISPLMYSYLLVGSSRLVVVNEAKGDQRNFLFVCGDQIHTAIRRISHGKPSSFFICLFPMPMRQTLVRWRCGLLAAGCRLPAAGAGASQRSSMFLLLLGCASVSNTTQAANTPRLDKRQLTEASKSSQVSES